jgi:L,D-transpeptidase ErfK/SrfK
MARWLSYLGGLKSGRVFVGVAVVGFGVLVFLLFRGHAAGPQEAVAGDMSSIVSPPGNPEAIPSTAAGTPAGGVSSLDPGQGLSIGAAPPSGAAPSLSAPEVDAALTETLGLLRAQPGEVIQVRNKLNTLLQSQASPEQRQTIKDEMARLSKDWLFGPAAYPGDMLCDTYTVKSGDLLDVLGRRMKVPYQILMQVNNIQRARGLQMGRAIKVIHGPFNVKVSRSAFTLDLYLQDTYVRSFKVGLGKSGRETPTGHWRVQEHGKLEKPQWTDPDTNRLYKSTDPDYPLGTRWIGLEGLDGLAKGKAGFAIHGTKDPDQIGTAGSRGCIRMYNDDVELMYSLLIPIYSQVEVID